jgi:hypothetical protein
MPIIENEPDDLSLDNETPPAAPPKGGSRPFLLASLGLALMLGGYAALTYVPLTPRQAEQERQLAEVRDLAAKSHAEGTAVGALEERLKQVEPPWRTPPYQLPGRLALFGGLFLFLAAGFLMYRKSPTPKTEPEEE